MTESALNTQEAAGTGGRTSTVAPSEAPGRKSRWLKGLRFLVSFPAMLGVGLVVVGLMTISNRFNDPDLWFHLRLGQIVWDTKTLPSTDLFSFTAFGHPWTAHEWLAQLAIYGAYRSGGYSGLMLWFAVVTALLPILVFYLCYRHCHNALVSFLGGLCAWYFSTVGLAIRPLLVGHVFLVIELIILEAGLRDRRRLWALPPLFAIWVNCHGSYFFGIGVVTVYWICSFLGGKWGLLTAEASDRATRIRLGVTLLLCGAALCCNPVGFRLLLYPLDALFHQKTGLNAVDEWLPPDLRDGRALAMIGLVIGVFLISLARRVELRLRELLLVAMGFGLALQHFRMLFLFGILISPVLCRLLAAMMGEDSKRQHPVANAVLIFAAFAAVAAIFPTHEDLVTQVGKRNPVGAVDFIRRAGLSGPMLNEYVFGGYLMWALPEQKVFIDGRGDVYDWTGVFAEYGRWATLSEDPKILLDKYGIRFCLVSKDSPPGRVMPYLGWRKAFSDDVATVYVKNER